MSNKKFLSRELGIDEIPVEDIGLYSDDYRSEPVPSSDDLQVSTTVTVEEYPIPGE